VPPKQSSPAAVLGVLGALTAFGPLSIDMYLPALPTIQRELATSAAATQRTLSAYFIGLALAQLAYGPLSDRFGRRKPLFFGLSLYAASSIGASLAPTITVLAAMRALQAVGGAAGMVVTRAVIRDLYSGRAAANALSTLILIMGAAPILAPLLGGVVLDISGWRAIFVFLATCGVFGLLAVAAILPETGTRSRPSGVVRTYLELARDPLFIGYTLAGGFGNAGLFAYIAAYPFVVIELHHVSARAFGWWFGANAVAYIAVAQLNRLLLRRWGPTELLAASTVLASVFALACLLVVRNGLGLPAIAICVFLFVGSLAVGGPNATALAMEEQPTRAGAASALLGTVQFSIAATASWIVGAFAERSAAPMAKVMLACAVLSFGAQALATRRSRRVA
jgi:DHA1 family bicyclomycin/chloramphenicol resistance-like MFS transporter